MFDKLYSHVVLTMSDGPPAQVQSNFARTSKFFSFFYELHVHKNKFKDLIRPENSNVNLKDCHVLQFKIKLANCIF